jgi:hypothetical protein
VERQKGAGLGIEKGETLFSYGSLRDEKVQQAIFGHSVEGRPDAVIGYRLAAITLSDPKTVALSGTTAHHILEVTGRECDQIEGMTLALSESDLLLADAYEPPNYKRVRARLRSGGETWVYVRG